MILSEFLGLFENFFFRVEDSVFASRVTELIGTLLSLLVDV